MTCLIHTHTLDPLTMEALILMHGADLSGRLSVGIPREARRNSRVGIPACGNSLWESRILALGNSHVAQVFPLGFFPLRTKFHTLTVFWFVDALMLYLPFELRCTLRTKYIHDKFSGNNFRVQGKTGATDIRKLSRYWKVSL